MSTMHLYPKVERKARDFKGVKEVAVPSQSMSLREIIKRFVRGESIPAKKEGFYEDRMGDLEKLANADITVQLERAEEIRQGIAKADKRRKEAKQVVTVPPNSGIGAEPSDGFAGDGAAGAAKAVDN